MHRILSPARVAGTLAAGVAAALLACGTSSTGSADANANGNVDSSANDNVNANANNSNGNANTNANPNAEAFGSATSTGDHVQRDHYRPSGHAAAGEAFVELFQWPWDDIAQECAWLGAAGYRAVQISPPQEHVVAGGNPWWEHYQAVSYKLESRLGTEAQLAAMVQACKAAGVDVYADTVINHTTGTTDGGVGYAGSPYRKYHYPDYGPIDFHAPCPLLESDFYRVDGTQAMHACQLWGLEDLDTGSEHVRDTLAGYLIRLNALGVAGYRVDAANHLSADDLDAIVARVNRAAIDAGRAPPYFFMEAWDAPAAPLAWYVGVGYESGGVEDLAEWGGEGVYASFTHYDGAAPSQLAGYPRGWGLLPADEAVVFVTNHDDERGGISYRDVGPYRLATLFQLASGYGYVQVMSSYAFGQRDTGPVADASGHPLPIWVDGAPRCRNAAWAAGQSLTDGDWVCQHRDPAVAAMVGFRRRMAGEPDAGFQAVGSDVVGFARGTKGFVAFNGGTARAATFTTPLPPGTYCDLLTGGAGPSGCAGASYVVDAAGTLTATLPAGGALAIEVAAAP